MGLALSTREFYISEILKVLRKYGKVSTTTIIYEMRKNPQRRFPLTEERIVSFLKYLRATDQVIYHRNYPNKKSSRWEVK